MRNEQDNIMWEVIATSRYTDKRFSQVGMQVDPIKKSWQQMQDLLILLDRLHRYLETLARQEGAAYVTGVESNAESLAAAEHGEYPSVILARNQFTDFWFLDKPLLRFLVRYVLAAGQTVGEFGAFGGRYSEWLNDTGLVEAFAFDGIPRVAEITEGRVQELQLGVPFDLGRSFDWVLSLEVGEHLPKEAANTFLSNIARHARVGAIISWATPDFPSPYHPNTLPVEESTRLIEGHGFRQAPGLTQKLRDTAETDWLKQTAAVYFKS